MVDTGSCTWVDVPGTNPTVRIQIQNGQPLQILRAWVADINAYVEHVRDGDTACWTATNSVGSSNHLSGCAVDIDWDSHPFRVADAGFNGAQIATIRELLDFYEGTVFWGNDWTNPKDAMHFQLGSRANGGDIDTYGNPHTQDFINRKIRADGFSTFRRDNNPTPPPPPSLSNADRYAVAIIGEGRRRNVTPRGIQIALSVALVESGLKMYANSNVPQSLSIPHDAVGSDHDSLGLFQQRCPMWGPAEVLMNPALSAGLFYDRLTKMDYNNPNRLPGDYAADVQRPAAQYRGRYQERMGDAVALYNRLADTPVQGEDQLSAEAERMIRELYNEYQANRHAPSRSFFAKDQQWGESPLGFQWNMDGNINELYMTWGYLLGVTSIESAVESIAANGVAPESWAGSMDWLAEVGQQWCQGLIGLRKAMQAAFRGGQPAAQVDTSGLSAENAWLRAENARLKTTQVVYKEPPTAELAQVAQLKQEPAAGSTGEAIGQLYTALESLRLADALPIESRAPLAALISVLQTKNGSDIK